MTEESPAAAHLTVLTGFIAGTTISIPSQGITLGRNQDVGLRFDPQQDLRVSGRHAAILPAQGGGWMVRDLGSLNGTFVNGSPVMDPVLIKDGDQIQLGEGGPTVAFRILSTAPRTAAPQPQTAADLQVQPFVTSDSRPAATRGPRPGDGSPSTRADSSHPPVAGEGRRRLTPVALLSVMLLAVIGVAIYSTLQGRQYRAQVDAMQERIDSILAASAETAGAFQGRIQGLYEALQNARADLESVRADLEAAEESGDSDEIRGLRVQLQEAQTALVRHQLAANLDFDVIEGGNRRAVAKVFVDFGEEVVTATAFAVRSDGTLITNRHVVSGSSGTRRAQRIAVQFADSRQVWPARVLATSRTVDLALLKVDNIVGDVPTVMGFNDRPGSIQAGDGVGIIGFPLGGAEIDDEGSGAIARTTLTAGIVQNVAPGMLEVNGYGVAGSSGSPVFDGNGEVVGILFGGRVENGERTLFAVPAARAVTFLGGSF